MNPTICATILATLAVLPLSVRAGSLSEVNHWILASENDASSNFNFNVSVNATNPGFSGSVDKSVNETFANPIEGYSFFNQASAGVIGSYASLGSRIPAPAPVNSTNNSQSELKLWTTTDPDSVPGVPVDYATSPDYGSNTLVRTYAANGTIDIAGLEMGTIYIFYGAYRNTPQWDFTMTGSGQPDVELLDVGDNDFANNNEFYAYAFSFDNTGNLYDTISYSFSIPEVNDGRGRLGGIVITAPSSGPSGGDFVMTITPNGSTPGNYDFEWDSQQGKVYDLVSATDLTTAPDTWAVWDGREGLTATPPTNSLNGIPGGGDTRRFFAVVERDAPAP